ncbi:MULTISPECIES: type 1 fimbrial protein [unclassified Burkholderia]|uniref:type 1 fimbrial protein n=1 Tax=unclassified Burkholderia TaxID=2613784 RepID=UPI000F56B120|nr:MULTISPECIES: type 1 fimbrial protein [unclassified Burkholderia]RQR43373.1 type 1 fimbrial protein [Burkholderia sp. Bp9131]RQR74244.1 type 1 fimbrial protein [Burkholderia sp. Bp9015]RQS01131.1 type 1 fimbrial protein [Burkholderia sp. Bp8994]RQS28120.1 type 1 fimbrial protein [Burkholderia sp. Bp8995]RQS46766.1 type 1 fimbrial protein [Burkholderia sp. Bp8989]
MKHRLFAASFALAAALLASSSSFAAGASGIIHFTGMIVEPPCSFALDTADIAHAHVRTDCPRPATGQVAFVDAASLRTIKTTTFTQASRAIVLPDRPGNAHAPMIAVVTYQ